MSIELGVLITVAGIIFTAAAFFIGRMTAAKAEGRKDGELAMEMKFLRDSVDKMAAQLEKANLQGMQATINILTQNDTRKDESIRRLHERIDKHLQTEHKMVVGHANT